MVTAILRNCLRTLNIVLLAVSPRAKPGWQKPRRDGNDLAGR
jgi:hypothetical protein